MPTSGAPGGPFSAHSSEYRDEREQHTAVSPVSHRARDTSTRQLLRLFVRARRGRFVDASCSCVRFSIVPTSVCGVWIVCARPHDWLPLPALHFHAALRCISRIQGYSVVSVDVDGGAENVKGIGGETGVAVEAPGVTPMDGAEKVNGTGGETGVALALPASDDGAEKVKGISGGIGEVVLADGAVNEKGAGATAAAVPADWSASRLVGGVRAGGWRRPRLWPTCRSGAVPKLKTTGGPPPKAAGEGATVRSASRASALGIGPLAKPSLRRLAEAVRAWLLKISSKHRRKIQALLL